jgi:zinc/manganese transport system substrate-binding protein
MNMKKLLIAAACLLVPAYSFGERIQVVTTYPYIASIAGQVGGDRVRVNALAGGQWDPHTIVPKPSFIAKVRRAELLIINGGQLEIGWLPPLMNQANNPRIRTGSNGLLDLSRAVTLIDVPRSVSRAQGDVHPAGNPHYYLDPHNIPKLSKAIAQKLGEIDPQGTSAYENNNKHFTDNWNRKLAVWDRALSSLRGARVIEYHKNYDYLLRRYGIVLVGTIEPLPGIPPTSKHIESLETLIHSGRPRFILQDVYNPDSASKHLSQKFGIPLVRLPHDVEAVREAEGIYSLFDEIVRRLTNE